MIERVCIIGAGTIGSLLAGHLGGVCEVSVLTRRPEHATMLRERGLRVSGKHELRAPMFATADAAELPEFDVGIFACKALDLDQSAVRLAGLPGGSVPADAGGGGVCATIWSNSGARLSCGEARSRTAA